ncbi:hypothetical protein [Streptomyces sp. GC420]|uniref:hypothetical protein n=1 Tax=Streptomyces sp. GC420 TaxID=2697568 RepID=UPI0014151F9C|nr:hypothetical protein [Streptomyces sp. GC420]NBM20984.1 hypothetical protein [Streptomyces sp. GC420]
MRAIRAASATAVLGITALTLTAPPPAASAQGATPSFRFSVNPVSVPPGGTVTLRVTDCAYSVSASSGAFDTVAVPQGRSVTATVDPSARAGAVYPVTFVCNGETGTTNITIASRTPTTSSTSRPPATRSSTAGAGVRGGLGGSRGGVDSMEIAIGAALVGGSAGAAFYVLRRRGRLGRH